MREGRHGILPVAAMAATCLMWGTMVPFTAELFETVDPLFFSVLRYPMGAGALLFLVLATERRLLHPARLPVGRVLALGGVGTAGWATFYAAGIYLSDAITAAAVLATGPVVAAVWTRFLTSERLQARLVGGVALAVLGGVLVALGKPGPARAAGIQGGEVFLVAALCCWSWYSIKAQQWLAPLGVSQVRLTYWTLAAGCLWVWLVYLLAWALGLAAPPAPLESTTAWAMLVWIGLGGTGVAAWFWNYGASRLGVTVATININLVPLIAVLTSTALGHSPTAAQLAGGAIVIAGVLWVQLGGRKGR
ncbi:MAG: DMT family transporter [Alphaproteobacteria bacterium]|nr:DMT family transporter [Alphaproteobacteria bacterium]